MQSTSSEEIISYTVVQVTGAPWTAGGLRSRRKAIPRKELTNGILNDSLTLNYNLLKRKK